MMSDLPFTDEEYGKVLDNLVVACVDVAITCHNSILLDLRQNQPIKGNWWIFGGRVNKGETLQEAAKRGVYRELSLVIEDISRFKELGVYNLRWPLRREPVATNGCHHLLVAHQIELTDSEKDQVDNKLRGSQSIKWFAISDLENEEILPELSDIIRKLK